MRQLSSTLSKCLFSLIMTAAREQLFLVGGSDTTYYNTSCFAIETLPVVLKQYISLIYCDLLFGRLGHLGGVSDFFYSFTYISYKENILVEVFFVEIFYRNS